MAQPGSAVTDQPLYVELRNKYLACLEQKTDLQEQLMNKMASENDYKDIIRAKDAEIEQLKQGRSTSSQWTSNDHVFALIITLKFRCLWPEELRSRQRRMLPRLTRLPPHWLHSLLFFLL